MPRGDHAPAYELDAANLGRRKRGLLSRLNVRAAYRCLFVGSDGRLKDDAAEVLADLCVLARLGKDRPLASADELRERAAMRRVVLHIFARLDPKAVADFSDKLREE